MWDSKKDDKIADGDQFTFIGKGAVVKGELRSDGMLRIDGRVEGDIHSPGTVMVTEHAVIKGNIWVGTLTINGKIKGSVTATEKVELLKSAVLIGEVHSPSFVVETGAHYQGTCDMGTNPWREEDGHSVEGVHDMATHRQKVRAPLQAERKEPVATHTSMSDSLPV
jgi:cytoskeletal protein CcmA (bactofilin family)